MSQGYLISFEGGEGGGKSTQIEILRQRLAEAGKDVISVREPGGSAIAEQIREVVLSNKNMEMAFTTEVLLFQASRAQVYQEVVLPHLNQGKIILMDRTRDSSVVYQGIVRQFGQELIEQLNDISTQKTHPNLTFLLDVPVEVGLKRRQDASEMDRIELEKKDFHQQVRDAYLSLARDDKAGRWQIINAEEELEKISDTIWQLTKKNLHI